MEQLHDFTHGGYDPRFDSNQFSQQDKNLAHKYEKPFYVATPNGSLLVYDPVTGVTREADRNMPFDPKDPTSPNHD